MPVSQRGSILSSRSDAEQARFMDDLEDLEVTEELSGFNSDNEEHRGHTLNVGDTMSDIGRVVSQTEAGMDFTTNLEAPMEGVQRRARASAQSSISGRPARSGAGLGLLNGKPSPYEDMSMSRLADSYWRQGNESGSENAPEFTRDDLGTMEFVTTQSALAAGVSRLREGEDGETASDSFLAHANGRGSSQHQHRMGSFYSDSHYQQQQHRPMSAESGGSRPLPRRPESYHDGPSTSSHQQQPLPTFSSTNDSRSAAVAQTETANDRLARLVARYSGDPQRVAATNTGGYGAGVRDISSEGLSDDGMLPALPETPDVHTAFTSIGQFSSVHSASPPPANNGRMPMDPSIVERTRTALQQRLATSDQPGDEMPADGPSYSEMRQRFLGGSSQQQYAGHKSAMDVGNRSMESLDHPNMGSQGTRSPGGSSMMSMGDGGETKYFNGHDDDDDDRFMRPMDGGSEDEGEFGAGRVNSFGISSDEDRGGGARHTRLSGHFDTSFNNGATGEQFNPVEDADELFGDHYTNSSNPDFSDIVRDHERVFSDLFDSDSENEKSMGPHDSTEAPASLFASSSSIVAEISRRQAIGNRKKGKLSTWDGREATPDAMRRQEQMFGVHSRNPIEMQGKINSLGLEDHASDVSGLLPESEHSPRTLPQGSGKKTRSNTGVSLAQLGRVYRPAAAEVSAFPITPQSAPLNGVGYEDQRPPTTPTTFISRDTRHGPSTRVLHQVLPLEQLSPPNGLAPGQQEPTPSTMRFRDEARGPQKRPVGPRSIDQSIGKSNAGSVKSRPPMLDIVRQTTPNQRRNERAAAQFAQAASAAASNAREPAMASGREGAGSPSDVSSHGLGSLFMDSLPVLDGSRMGRSQAPVTPAAPFHALSRILNNGHGPRSPYSPLRSVQGAVSSPSGTSSMLLNTNGYVPFQDPTVDISNLPKYHDVDLQRQVPDSAMSHLYSATPSERHDASFGPQSRRRVSPWSHVRSHGDSGSDMVATVKYDSPTPGHSLESLSLSDIGMDEASVSSGRNHISRPVTEGPTLRDIYDLLKRTVSSIDAQHKTPVNEVVDGLSAMNFDDTQDKFGTAASSMHVVPRQLQSQPREWIDYRPAAPTPRRSRHFPTQFRDEELHSESEDGVAMADEVSRARGDTGQSRVRAYLQRYTSESAIGQSQAGGYNPRERGSAPPALPASHREEEEAEKILVDLLSFVSGGDADLESVLGRKLPPALADKLRELARVLALATAKEKPTAPVADEAVQTEAPVAKEPEGLRVELMRLQREILDKFDEYRAEVDQLRNELRRGSLPHQSPSTVAPHDSVSVVGDKRTPTSPRPSSVQPMYSVPTTARNRQRHMVQWLGQQSKAEVPISPTKPASSVRGTRQSSVGRHRADMVEDVDEGLGSPKRMSDYDDALSDTSTTVPDRMPLRRPMDPATILRHTPGRTTRNQAVSPWDGHEDLLATREALDSIRGHKQRKGVSDDDFGREVYGREVAQQLGDTLAELQRVHAAQFHGSRALTPPCPVCRALEAQNHDPYLFGRRAVAYRSMSTRQLQGLLNAYVAAMQEQAPEKENVRARTSFTPNRAKSTVKEEKGDPSAAKVIGLLRDELDALSRRYHRLVEEFHRLDPSRAGDQRKRRMMSKELKDLVDVLDGKGEQIAILASLHPDVVTESAGIPKPKELSSTQRALASARELQNALGDLY